ncbi:MAG: nucleotidyltransferase [Candidatus Aureabacteria bacterium]|nr:nucleotidyltransferase [Candidatus Auribacterota bacterium]
MLSDILTRSLKTLVTLCRKKEIRVVLMGGIATSFYARPRATYDIDGIIDSEKHDLDKFLPAVTKLGFGYDEKKPVKFIHGLPFITLFHKKHKLYVDLFIAETVFQKGIVKRARRIKFGKMPVDIISREDLILLKLQTGREKDTEDARNIIAENSAKLDFAYLGKWANWLGVKAFLNDEIKSLGIKLKKHR